MSLGETQHCRYNFQTGLYCLKVFVEQLQIRILNGVGLPSHRLQLSLPAWHNLSSAQPSSQLDHIQRPG